MTETLYHSLRLELDPAISGSLLTALREAGLPVSRLILLSEGAESGGVSAAITALRKVFPWNAISEVLVAWLDTHKACELKIHRADGTMYRAKGKYAVDKLSELLKAELIEVTQTETASTEPQK